MGEKTDKRESNGVDASLGGRTNSGGRVTYKGTLKTDRERKGGERRGTEKNGAGNITVLTGCQLPRADEKEEKGPRRLRSRGVVGKPIQEDNRSENPSSRICSSGR